MTIGNYASGKKVISVASYITKGSWKDFDSNDVNENLNVGAKSDFSSIGPTRDGRLCPVISAPGQVIFAPLSSHLTEGEGYSRQMVPPGGGYQGMSGTSMATPHVTGVIGLLLQANPKLKYEDIVSLFSSTSRKDSYTGTLPNNMFGYGKIDAYAVVKGAATDISGDMVTHQGIIDIFPQPSKSILYIESDNLNQISSIEIYDFLGRKMNPLENHILSDNLLTVGIDDLSSGVYNIKLNFGKSFTIKSFIKE